MRAVCILAILMLAYPLGAFAQEAPEPELIFEQTIFDASGGELNAPLADKTGGHIALLDDGSIAGWVQDQPDGYVSFDADKVFFPDKGSIEVKLVVLDPKALGKLGNDQEALLSLYDRDGTPFFTIGVNGHDFSVGSYQLHPMIMEDVFGGVGFPYLAWLKGPLEKGTKITITVTWGTTPADNKVYINGAFIGVETRRGPRNMGGSPGYDPVKTLGSFMHGFEVFDGRKVGPPRELVIGRVGERDPDDPVAMYPPTAVAVRSVRVWNRVEPPKGG